MSLRYSFRHLFFGGRIQKERLYKVLEDLDSATGGDATDISALEESVSDLETAIGDESTANSILGRIKALEDASKE